MTGDTPFTSLSLRQRRHSKIKLPPISQILRNTQTHYGHMRLLGLCNLKPRWTNKLSNQDASTRSWLDPDATDDQSQDLRPYVEFLIENLNEACNGPSWTDLLPGEMEQLVFQRRIACASYKVRVNSGPVKTRTPESLVHARKERKRRTHQRGVLEVTDLTTSEFIRDISNKYIDLIKKDQEADLQEEAIADGETYVSRTRSGNLSRKGLSRRPNKDEVHVRALFTSILNGLMYKHQATAYRELMEEYTNLKAHIVASNNPSDRCPIPQYSHTLPSIRLDTTSAHYQPVSRGQGSPLCVPRCVESLQAARDPVNRKRETEADFYIMESKPNPYGLPSPVSSVEEGSCPSSFSHES